VPAGLGSDIDGRKPPASILLAKWPQQPAGTVLEIRTALNDRHGLLETKSAGRAAAIVDNNGGEIRQRRNPFPVGKNTGSVDRDEIAESDRALHPEAVCRGWHSGSGEHSHKSMRDVTGFRVRTIPGCLAPRVLRAVRRDVFLAPVQSRTEVALTLVFDPEQQTAQVKTEVPSELQMSLLDSRSLVPSPQIGRARGRCSPIGGYAFHDEGSRKGVSQRELDGPRQRPRGGRAGSTP
jgi:hypothetical protein